MALNGYAVAYCVAGGLVLFSGIKGASLNDTARQILSGDLTGLPITEQIKAQNSSAPGTPSGSPGAGPVASGNQVQNGTIIYKYFRSNGYSPIQAAGAIASMWGESGWNPESVGTGGNGLIGWTPPLPGIVTGNASADMSKQLPLILQFVAKNGDQGSVDLMAGASTVTAAANIWGKKVERFGINDVHSTGVNLAVQIANSVDHTNLKA